LSLLNSIKRGVVMPVYLLYGEEEYLREMIVKTMKESLLAPGLEAFNLDELDGERCEVGSILERCVTLPVFAEKRLVIVKNPPFFQKGKKENPDEAGSKAEGLLSYLENPLSSTCLVFLVAGNVDKRKKPVKAVEHCGQILELAPLRGRELEEWIRGEAGALGKKIEPKALEYIIANSGNSLRNLKSELEKLAFYDNSATITLKAAKELLIKTAEANIFEVVDSIGHKRGEAAILELRRLLETGEPPVRVLFMIARQFRLLLAAKDLVQKGYAEKQITAELGVHPFVTGKILRQAKNFAFKELEESLQSILDTDIALKTGTAPKTALENLILRLVKNQGWNH
jgi:DNA polymerase-3 subunit delta